MSHDANNLRRDATELARNTGGGWVRIAGGGAGSDSPRAIRGVWVSGTSSLLINNIVVLDSGTDPRDDTESSTETVPVANIPGDVYTTGNAVYADWSETNNQWEARPKGSGAGGGSGTEKLRVIYGVAYSGANPATSTFLVNQLQVMAGGLDPRVDPTSSTETITVTKLDSITVTAGDNIAAAYNVGLAVWIMLPVERYRAIRGTWYSGTSTLLIDHIVVLDSGLDQRSDPTSTTEQISVSNIAGDTYGSGDDVWADFNHKDQLWEARPKSGSGGNNVAILKSTGTIAARVSGTPGSSTSYTGVENSAAVGGAAVKNWSLTPIISNTYLVVAYTGTSWIIIDAFC